MQSYDNLRELLAQEEYPHRYVHKFIAVKTPAFLTALARFEIDFPRARPVGERASAGARYLACTYEFHAESPDEIITLLQATALLPDLKMIL